MTTVVNARSVNLDDPDVVYIGRRMARHAHSKVRVGSVFGNPFKTSEQMDRAAAVRAFEQLMRQRLMYADGGPQWAERTSGEWRKELLALDGMRLACWCAPEACHGDVLVKLIEELKEKS